MSWVTLCELSEVRDAAGHYVEVDGYRLAVFRAGETVAVLDDRCPHAGASLSRGDVRGGCAICPQHGWQFDLQTGQVRHVPGAAVRVYRARVLPRAGREWVQAEL